MLKDATYEMAQAGKPSAFIAERLTAVYDLGVVTVRQVNRWLNERFNATRDETIANVFNDVEYLRDHAPIGCRQTAVRCPGIGRARVGGVEEPVCCPESFVTGVLGGLRHSGDSFRARHRADLGQVESEPHSDLLAVETMVWAHHVV